MKRNRFDTGKPHQNQTVVWARKRLVDKDGRIFKLGSENAFSRTNQHGVLFADGVGLGKTWEALAASALLLLETKRKPKAKQNSTGKPRPRKAHVLVLCPPGLVTKWAREIRDPKGFGEKLTSWSEKRPSRTFVKDTLSKPFQLRVERDLNALPSGKRLKYGIKLPAGTYVCSWNLLLKSPKAGSSRLSALRAHNWDVLIVDEAHHLEARKVLEKLEKYSRGISHTLLLSATPFQLEPHEIHGVFRGLLDPKSNTYQVLKFDPLKSFTHKLSMFFKGRDEPPSRPELKQVESTFKQLVARTATSVKRKYHLLNKDGFSFTIEPLERTSESNLKNIMSHAIAPAADFEEWYFKFRLRLADDERRTFVATKIRQSLSTSGQAEGAIPSLGAPPYSPRERALMRWAHRQFKEDLLQSAKDGYPRKSLVFTSFVKTASKELQAGLTRSFNLAYKGAAQSAIWREISQRAPQNFLKLIETFERLVNAEDLSKSRSVAILRMNLNAMNHNPDMRPFYDLLGHNQYLKLVQDDLTERLEALAEISRLAPSEDEKKFHRYELRIHNHNLEALASQKVVETYVGHDDRKERDARGEAFRTPFGPWVLVASNVGSEGIDLHTFASHLIHFDVEWNPGKMEQREGRVDRYGRKLESPINIYYLFVQGTYDERMLHQMVARQRWHSVLLGARLGESKKKLEEDVPFLECHMTNGLMLNLAPKS